jgi:peptidyl-prolyl cis-trans isomerase B (cyclophilin B)
VAGKKNRQRQLERARTERRIARQAAAERRRRQIQAGVGAGLAVVLIVVGTIWLLGGFKPKPKPTVVSGTCTWNLLDTGLTGVKDTGNPPPTGEVRTGTVTLYMRTNLGDIEAEMDRAKAPCTVASFIYLAGKKFFDNTTCHRVTTSSIYVLQCGDPLGDGTGRPSYQFANENVPPDPRAASPSPSAESASPSPSAAASTSPAASASPSPSPSPTPAPNLYPRGTLAMANSGAGTNGSQFFIVYKDGSELAPAYTIFGRVTKGLDIVEKVAAAGAVDPTGATTGDGRPVLAITITAFSIGTPLPEPPSPSATPPPSTPPGTTPSTTQGATQ